MMFYSYVLIQSILLKNAFASGGTNAFSGLNFSLENESAVEGSEINDPELYLKGVNDSLSAMDLEYMLDYYDKDLLKKYDFDPPVIVKHLVGIAQLHKTTPERFQEDIKDLIVLHRRLKHLEDFSTNVPIPSPRRSDTGKRKTRGVDLNNGPELHESHIAEVGGFTNWKNGTQNETKPEDAWMEELRLLEKKYNVSSLPTYSNSLTHSRLSMMFPHYGIIGKFRSTSMIPQCQGRPCYIYYDSSAKYISETGFPSISIVFQREDFGGWIPRPGALKAEVRKAIITVHLQFFTRLYRSKAELVPFRAQSVLLKWRIEKSLLSDERRVRLLQNYDVITEDGELRTNVKQADAEISEDVKRGIFWQLLNSP